MLLSSEDKNLNRMPPAGSSGNEYEPSDFWGDLKKYLTELKEHKLLCFILVVVIAVFFVLPVCCAYPFVDWKEGLTAVASGLASAAGMASVILACYSVKQTWESDKSVRHILESVQEVLGKTQETQRNMLTLQDEMRKLQSNSRWLQNQLDRISLDVKHIVEVAEENREGIRALKAKAMDYPLSGSASSTEEEPFGEGNAPDELNRTGEPIEADSERDDGNGPET